jgi:hypothetical protein
MEIIDYYDYTGDPSFKTLTAEQEVGMRNALDKLDVVYEKLKSSPLSTTPEGDAYLFALSRLCSRIRLYLMKSSLLREKREAYANKFRTELAKMLLL